ncbi:HEAT repeat domain-containing protein [Candidatus Poribacteria bacterium]
MCRALFVILMLLIFLSSAYSDQEGDTGDLDVLEKLSNSSQDIWSGAGYDLALMEKEAAIALLLQALTDESHETRWHSASFLDIYSDQSVLPRLREAFLNDTDEHVREVSARTLANINPAYAAEVLLGQIGRDGDPLAQKIAAGMLSEMGDRRVIPFLVQRLGNPDTQWDAALGLGRFGDKRSVPALIGMLPDSSDDRYTKYYSTENIVEALLRIGDVRCIPALLNDENARPVFLNRLRSHIRRKSEDTPSDFALTMTPLLIDIVKKSPSSQIRSRAADALGNVDEPALAPIFGKLFLETDNKQLRRAAAEALLNMGPSAFEYLLAGTKKEECYRKSLSGLASYGTQEAFNAVSQLALDLSYPFRLQAIKTLANFSYPWREDILPSVLKLLHDPDVTVRLNAIYILKKLEIHEAADVLREATGDPDKRIRDAASHVLLSLSDETPFILEIKMGRTVYPYDALVNMKYTITNVSPYPITVRIHRKDRSLVMDGVAFGVPEIRKLDGTSPKYVGPHPGRGPHIKFRPSMMKHKTLKPGDKLSGKIPIWELFEIYQPGRYTAKISCGLNSGDKKSLNLVWWSDTLTSQEVTFEVSPPSPQQLKAMMEHIDMPITRMYRFDKAHEICHRLGELQDASTIEALQRLALYQPPKPVGREKSEKRKRIRREREKLSEAALESLARIPARELIPMWVKLLSNKEWRKREITLDALAQFRHPRLIEQHRRQLFSMGSYPIYTNSTGSAFVLRDLGDNMGVDWLQSLALRRLTHRDTKERQNAVKILTQIGDSAGIRSALADEDPDVRRQARSWLYAVAEDMGIAAITPMLDDPDVNVQKAAAYQLAVMGNEAGIHLIQQDLKANHVQIRRQARDAMSALYKQNMEN